MDGYGDYFSDEPDLEVPELPAMAPAPMAAVPSAPMYGPQNNRAPLRPPELPPPMPMPGMAPPRRPMAPMAMGGPVGPDGMGVVDEALPTSHLLGLSVLLPAAGTIAGMKFAGMYGGLGGALGMGSLLNGYRAVKYMVKGDKESDREALVSGTYAVLGLGAAAWLFYKGMSSSRPNKTKPESDDELNGVE